MKWTLVYTKQARKDAKKIASSGLKQKAQELLNLDQISGGSPYGASTVAGPRGERTPTANELAIARFQGRYVAQLAAKLSAR